MIFKDYKSYFDLAYRVNHLKESLENRSEDGVIKVVHTCCALKRKNGHGAMTKMPTMCNTCVIQIHKLKKNLLSPPTKQTGKELQTGMYVH